MISGRNNFNDFPDNQLTKYLWVDPGFLRKLHQMRSTVHFIIIIIMFIQSINQSKHISIAPYVASESEAHDDGN